MGQFATHRSLLGRYLAPQRRGVAALAILLLSSIGLQLANPQILRRFIDLAAQQGAIGTLTVTGLLFVGVALLQQVVSVGATYFSENVGWTATNNLRADLLDHCLRLDQSFHKSRTPGELIERIDGDVTTLATFFSQLVIQVLGNMLLLAGVLVMLWSAEWRIGLLLTCFALAVLGSLFRIQAYIQPFWKQVQATKADLFGYLEERLSATEDIRSSGAQDYTLRGLYDRHRRHFQAAWSARIRAPLIWSSSDLLFTTATCATLVWSAALYRSGSLSLGTIFSVFTYIGMLWMPLHRMAQQAEEFQKAGAGIARIQELFATQTRLAPATGDRLPAGALPVEFEKVSFGYEDEDLVLRDVSLRLRAGEVLGILGRTGSGKTTLTRLLFRLYDPQNGAIYLADRDVRSVPLEDLRRRVGIVTQEVQLFHATVRDNLTFFDRTIDDERILLAIRDLGLEPWYRSLPEGLDTVLAAGSGGLSAGEAQLLAFTRIFLRDPGLVILDEASSRLDPATEGLIEQAIDKLLQGRTGMVIAHRLETLHRADEILIMEAGQVAEYGPRAALLADEESRFNALLRTGIEEALA